MIKGIIIVTLLFSAVLGCFSQEGNSTNSVTPQQKAAIDETGKLNTQLISLFGQKKFSDALKIARQTQDLIGKNALADNFTVVPTLNNIAEVYLANNNEEEALKIFLPLLETYRKKLGESDSKYLRTVDRISVAYFNWENYGKSAEYAQQSLSLRQKLYGIQSKEVAVAQETLAKAYWKEGKWELANRAFLEAIDINDGALNAEERRVRKDVAAYDCFISHWGYSDGDFLGKRKRADEFLKARSEKERAERDGGDEEKITGVGIGVVNGKATYLARPSYPAAAAGRSGFVVVKVEIDEKGKVTKATATCGINPFLRMSEEAARRSTFKPTTLNGEAVKVSGIIVYNYGA